jgi:cytochrome P450
MAELLQNPVQKEKVRNELLSVIGQEREMEESDISRLPYLHAVVKETLRLHPPVPFLLPRRALETVELGGYLIPKGAKVEIIDHIVIIHYFFDNITLVFTFIYPEIH